VAELEDDVAEGVALAVGELVAGVRGSRTAPVIAVGDEVIERVPRPVKDWAIDAFGTADKVALLIGIYALLALFAALIGVVAVRRLWLGAAGIALFGLGIAWREWPYVLLSPIGPVMGVRALRYSSRLIFPGWLHARPNREKSTGKNIGWREEHIVAMSVSGIAVHTALLVFGIGRTLGITLTGPSAYVPWLLPAAVGLPLLVWRVRRVPALPSTSPTPLRTPPPR